MYHTRFCICYDGAMVHLVGILNITPDSFSDGGQFFDATAAVLQAESLFAAGATWVDVGAESTRPHAQSLTDDEEWSRLEPVLRVLISRYPGKISLDTYHPTTVTKAWAFGPIIINDVTGFHNPDMMTLAADLGATVIVSHLPKVMTIQQAHELTPISMVEQVRSELIAKAKELEAAGILHKNIILDPGIGFGKTPELNRQLLTFADQIQDYRVMIGYSRKRFLGEDRMEIEPNLAAAEIAIQHGASYLRVHDVAGHAQLLS